MAPIPRKRLWLLFGAVVAVVGATLAGLYLLPIHRHFEMHGLEVWDGANSCSGIDATGGSSVNFHWWAATNISFGAWSCQANAMIYQSSGTSGASSFVSQGGVYEFGTICFLEPCVPANVSGDYTGPLLQL